MESLFVEGLYITGELLNVVGDCGGYNLGNAWITGLKAGTYKVRVKATEDDPCGNAADVTVGNNYKALDDSVSVIIKKGDSVLEGANVVTLA